MASKAEKIVALALSRVVARNMLAGRSVEYQQLLAEVEAEVGVLLGRRRGRRLERDARLARRAQELVCEAQVRLAAVTESRTASSGDVEREFRALDMALGPPGPPLWHPERSLDDDF